MDRNKQVRLFLVRDGGASLEWNESVVLARINYVGAESSPQQFAQPPPDIQYQIFLLQTLGPNGAGIVSAVTGINHNLADFQSQSTDQGTIATGSR